MVKKEDEFDQIRERIMGTAIEVCRTLGPGLLKSMSRRLSHISSTLVTRLDF